MKCPYTNLFIGMRKADVVIFDRETISETPAKGTQLAGQPEGITHVFINGKQVVEHGDYISSARAEVVIRA